MATNDPGEIGIKGKALVYYDSLQKRRALVGDFLRDATTEDPEGALGIELVDGTSGGERLVYFDFVNNKRALTGSTSTVTGLDPKELRFSGAKLVWATVDGNAREVEGDPDEAILPEITAVSGNTTSELSIAITTDNYNEVKAYYLNQNLSVERIAESEYTTSPPQGAIESVKNVNGLTDDDLASFEDTHDFAAGETYYYRIVNTTYTTTGPVQGVRNPSVATGPDAHWVGPVAPGVDQINEAPINGTWQREFGTGASRYVLRWEHPTGANYPYINIAYFNSGGSPRTNTGPTSVPGDTTQVITYDSGNGIFNEGEHLHVRVKYSDGNNTSAQELEIKTDDPAQEYTP